jgi:hypothetical protein
MLPLRESESKARCPVRLRSFNVGDAAASAGGGGVEIEKRGASSLGCPFCNCAANAVGRETAGFSFSGLEVREVVNDSAIAVLRVTGGVKVFNIIPSEQHKFSLAPFPWGVYPLEFPCVSRKAWGYGRA